MKKDVIILVLLSILLILPLVQAQTYSGFNRFTDNVQLFFSSDENKVNLALEIREKEINSILENLEEGVELTQNLERARNKLLIVQEKVSVNTAENVKTSVDEINEKLEDYESLPEEFENYKLEEEKTQLTAELTIEVEGKEGQTLTREIVKNETTGQNTVRIIVIGENGEEIITETQGQIGQIQNQIVERVIKMDIAGKIDKGDLVDGVYIARSGGNNSDDGLKPEVKTYVRGDGTDEDEPLPEPDLNRINPELYNPNARAPGDIINDPDGDNPSGPEDGTGTPGINEVVGGTGTEGTNYIAPAVDSNEGDSDGGDSGITGAVIGSEGKDNFFTRFFKRYF